MTDKTDFALHVVDDAHNSNRQESEVSVTIQAISVETGRRVRDAHLRSADFFEVEKYPTIEFRTELRPTKDPEVWTVVGDLTIRGVTRPVELTMTYLGVWGDPWGGTRAGFEGTAKGRHEPVSESGAGRWISLGRRRAPHGPPTSAGSR